MYPSPWEPDVAGGECALPGAGGEVAEGAGRTPTAPTGCGVLYSAHLGQLRLVSEDMAVSCVKMIASWRLTHVSHLSAMTAASLERKLSTNENVTVENTPLSPF